jgi:dienelactone hydrolase
MIKDKLVEYRHGDTVMEGLLAFDDAWQKPRPAVLIAHAWGGRSEFEDGKARLLAEMGYAGFALDLYGKGRRGSTKEENAKLMEPFMKDRALLQARMQAALETARAQEQVDRGRIAVMGFCFGGLCALDLARTGADVRGAVSFHGLFIPPGNTQGKKIRAKVLALHGHDDPMVPVEQVVALEKELTEAGADWQIHVYGNTMHAFTNPHANDPGFGTVYSEAADRRSWQALLNFLAEVLDGES